MATGAKSSAAVFALASIGSLFGLLRAEVIKFKRTMLPDDPLYTEFALVENVASVSTLGQCASLVHTSLTDSAVAPADKFNAFKFDSETNTCSLGKLPYNADFLAKLPVITEDAAGAIYGMGESCNDALDTSTLFHHLELLEDSPVQDLTEVRNLYFGNNDYISTGGTNWDYSRKFLDGRFAFKSPTTTENHNVKGANVEALTSLSILGWIYTDESMASKTQLILSSVTNGNWNSGMRVHLVASAFPKKIAIALDGSNVYVAESADNIVPSSRWVHFGIVYDYNADTVTFYIDGVQASSQVMGVPKKTSSTSATVIGMYSAYAPHLCMCDLADIQIHRAALSAAQVEAVHGRFSSNKVCGSGSP